MLSWNLIFALITTPHHHGVAHPTKLTEFSIDGVPPLFPHNTTITYYANPSCTPDASTRKDDLLAEYCTPICYDSVLIDAVPKNDCTFTIYTGSTTCSSGMPGIGGEQVRYMIAAGSGSLCVDSSILDGCRSESASGVWSCG
jgi:hypothetical protein